jgi:DNA adenine methylase
MKSLLRWAGSKRQILNELAQYWQAANSDRYIEVFAGSAALFFEVAPRRAVVNDLNSELIGFYRGIKNSTALVYELAASMPVNEVTYYETRKNYSLERDPIRRSAYFYYLNRYCFNGIYRTNAAGQFNVPFAKDRVGGFPQWIDVETAVKQLRKAATKNTDFESLVDTEVGQGDFVYLDPPYAVENQKIFTQYNATTFGLNDLDRLQATLRKIDSRGAKFVLSYAHCDEALSHFSKWHHRQVECQRNVAGFAKHRRKATELIISNIQLGESYE